MAVYTDITDAELADLLAGYDLGAPCALTGVAEGIENSNFLLDAQAGRFVLTVYERRVKAGDLPFFLQLMQHLAGRGFACPTPQPDRAGRLLAQVRGKPCAIVSFLPGRSASAPGPEHCRAAGEGLAALHAAGADFPGRRDDDLGVGGWRALFTPHAALAERLRPGLADLIARDLDAVERAWPQDLPQGVIHADFFPDNVFFDRAGGFAGAIDFYFACTGALAYDLAVAINAWAFPGGGLDPALAAAMAQGYGARRPLTAGERAGLGVLARGAALRFFLTRLADWEATPPGALVTRKDPLDYADRLDWHRGLAGRDFLEAIAR